MDELLEDKLNRLKGEAWTISLQLRKPLPELERTRLIEERRYLRNQIEELT